MVLFKREPSGYTNETFYSEEVHGSTDSDISIQNSSTAGM